MLVSLLRPVTGVELLKKVFTSRTRWMSLIVELNTSANMFYLLKHLLLLILLIFKLKCNNLFLQWNYGFECFICVFAAFSHHWESPGLDPGRQTPHFWGDSVTAGIRARSGLNTHSKHLKITIMFTVSTFSSYMDYCCLLRWQANMHVFL
jgi:hypothetical protein